MHDIDKLPLEQWAEQLKQARDQAGLQIPTVAHELMLSVAQLRCIEAGSLDAFHGPGYYLRAVEKYAGHLNLTLDPPITELRLTDSQIALNRVKNKPSAANLARTESSLLGANAMPRASKRNRLVVWFAIILLLLVGTGTWMALLEGWPVKHPQQITSNQTTPSEDLNEPKTIEPEISTQKSQPPIEPVPETAQNSAPPVISANPISPDTAESVIAVAAAKPTESAQDQTVDSQVESEPDSQARTEPALAPAPEPTPAPEVQQAPSTFEAEFSADCWVEVRFTDGRVEQRIYKSGESLSLPLNEIAKLTFGNAQAVSATRAGNEFDVLSFTRNRNNVARISAEGLRQEP